MLFVLLQILPWMAAALVLGGFTAWMLRKSTANLVYRADLPNMKRYALKSEASAVLPSASPDRWDEMQAELQARDAFIQELRTGLDREAAFRRAAIARVEGLMAEQNAAKTKG